MYLLIFEDGTPSQVELLSGEDKESIAGGYTQCFRYNVDTKHFEYTEDGDTFKPVDKSVEEN